MKKPFFLFAMLLLSPAFASADTLPQMCRAQTIDPGPCKGAFTRYQFDAATHSCTPFTWGGCMGTSLFPDEQTCMDTCAPPKGSAQHQLQQSQMKWEQLKNDMGRSYRYTVGFQRDNGYGHSTTITVEHDKVVARRYREWNLRTQATAEWNERGRSLGHLNDAAPAVTFDRVYQVCQDMLKRHADDKTPPLLELDEQGLLSRCLHSDEYCYRDCSRGIQVMELAFPEQAPQTPIYQPPVYPGH